ncbi:MAG TPA: YciI family protein, partial [Polyangiaceae bacterium]|nr:YciI family protein [Polyangiaceae bacterium]
EAGEPPDQRIIQSMGALVQESLKNGVFLNGAGLHASAKRKRLTRSNSGWTEQGGPYEGQNELVSSFVMIRDESLEDAVLHARSYAEACGDSAIEIGPVVEPWDLGVMTKPSGPVPQRFLLLSKADGAFERGETNLQKRNAALAELKRALEPDGAVFVADTLAPSAKAARSAPSSHGKRTWVDGPFAESKELIAGFSLLELPSRADAIAWADRYAAILVDSEVDVRELLQN